MVHNFNKYYIPYISRNFGGLIFGILSNNYIWRYINFAKFKVLLYNLKCDLHDWCDFNLASSEKIAKSPNFNPSQNFYSYGTFLLMGEYLHKYFTKCA